MKGVEMHFQRNFDTAAPLCAARIKGIVVEFYIRVSTQCALAYLSPCPV